MNIKKNHLLTLFNHWKKCFNYAPFPVIALILYMCLRSSDIFATEDIATNYQWHAAFAGWYDLFLAYSIILSFAYGVIKLEKDTLVFILTLSIIVLLSVLNSFALGSQYILDALVYLFRFILTFSLAKELVCRLGIRTVESLLIFLFLILSVTALFAYNLQFGTNNRIYAATMTPPSFGQVASVVVLIAVLRNYKIILLVSSVFLFLTFSRTSIILVLIFLFLYSWSMPFKTKLKYYTITIVLLNLAIFIFIKYGGDAFESVISSRTDIDEISTLNARDVIWQHALYLLKNRDIPVFGVGLASTPHLIENTNLKIVGPEGWYMPPHFHSIILEYALSLGFSSLVIFYYLFKRVWQTFTRNNCFPAFFIFAFFLISQSLDFTLFRPKEVIMWAFILGLAEGQWKVENS